MTSLPHESEITCDDVPRTHLSELHLREPGTGHNASLVTVACRAKRLGYSKKETLAHLKEEYDSTRPDYDTAPTRAVKRAWEAAGEISKLLEPKPPNPPFEPAKLERFKRTTKDDLLNT